MRVSEWKIMHVLTVNSEMARPSRPKDMKQRKDPIMPMTMHLQGSHSRPLILFQRPPMTATAPVTQPILPLRHTPTSEVEKHSRTAVDPSQTARQWNDNNNNAKDDNSHARSSSSSSNNSGEICSVVPRMRRRCTPTATAAEPDDDCCQRKNESLVHPQSSSDH